MVGSLGGQWWTALTCGGGIDAGLVTDDVRYYFLPLGGETVPEGGGTRLAKLDADEGYYVPLFAPELGSILWVECIFVRGDGATGWGERDLLFGDSFAELAPFVLALLALGGFFMIWCVRFGALLKVGIAT